MCFKIIPKNYDRGKVIRFFCKQKNGSLMEVRLPSLLLQSLVQIHLHFRESVGSVEWVVFSFCGDADTEGRPRPSRVLRILRLRLNERRVPSARKAGFKLLLIQP